MNTLLDKDVPEVVGDNSLPDSINQQMEELKQMLPTKRRDLFELREVQIHSIEPLTSVVDNDTVQILRMVHNRLNRLLDPTAIIDLEQRVDDKKLDEFINQQLTLLEEMLPTMRQDLVEFQEMVQTALTNRSMDSPSGSVLNSPSADSSAEKGLFSKLNALAKKVEKDQSSRNASRLPSTFSSPIAGGNGSITYTPTAKATPTRFATLTTEKQKAPKFSLDAATINNSDSDSEEKS